MKYNRATQEDIERIWKQLWGDLTKEEVQAITDAETKGAFHVHENAYGDKFRREFRTGRRKSPYAKQVVCIRLSPSWREKIMSVSNSEQAYIENAVRNKLMQDGLLCNTETA
jgi:hypothetical protein